MEKEELTETRAPSHPTPSSKCARPGSGSLPGLSKSRSGNLKIIELYERIMDRNIQEMAIAEQMILDGSYTPSEFRKRTARLGDLWSKADLEAMDRAYLPVVPVELSAALGSGDATAVSNAFRALSEEQQRNLPPDVQARVRAILTGATG